eukprot:g57057.t1
MCQGGSVKTVLNPPMVRESALGKCSNRKIKELSPFHAGLCDDATIELSIKCIIRRAKFDVFYGLAGPARLQTRHVVRRLLKL